MGVDIISTLTRKNGANFPLAAAEDIIGAFATVASTAARDAIPTAILRVGAIVRIGATSAYYEWTGSVWASVSFGGGGSGDVVGPAISVAGRLASFGDTSGKLLADSGFSTTAVAPAAVTKATAVAGTATSFSRSDHKHDVTTAAPGALSVSGVSAAEGSASSLARSDHTHSLTGTLPVANGGTGLTALGSALTYLRTNAAGTAMEWASVAAGVTAGNGLTGTTTFAVQPDGGTLSVSGAGVKVATGGISATELASNACTTAKILDANVTDAKLASTFVKANGTVAFSADQSLGNNKLTSVKHIQWSAEYSNGSSGTSKTLAFANGEAQTLSVNGNVTLTITPTAGVCEWMQVKFVQTGAFTVTHPVGMEGNVAPLGTTVGDKLIVTYFSDGTTLFGSTGGGALADGSVTTAKLAGAAVTGAKLVAGNAAGQELVWDGTQWLKLGRKTGSALTNASVTVQFTTAPQYFWPAATNTTANRTITLGTTGLAAGPNAGVGAILNFYILRSLSHDLLFVNGGAGAGTKFTLPSGSDPLAVSFYFDGTDWALAGWETLGTVTAA